MATPSERREERRRQRRLESIRDRPEAGFLEDVGGADTSFIGEIGEPDLDFDAPPIDGVAAEDTSFIEDIGEPDLDFGAPPVDDAVLPTDDAAPPPADLPQPPTDLPPAGPRAGGPYGAGSPPPRDIDPALAGTDVESGLDYSGQVDPSPIDGAPAERPDSAPRIPHKRNIPRDILRAISGVAQGLGTPTRQADFSAFDRLDDAQESRRQARQKRSDAIFESARGREDKATALERQKLEAKSARARKLSELQEGRKYTEGREDVRAGRQQERDVRQNTAAMERARVLSNVSAGRAMNQAILTSDLADARQEKQADRQVAIDEAKRKNAERAKVIQEHREGGDELQSLNELERMLQKRTGESRLPKQGNILSRGIIDLKAAAAGGSGMNVQDTSLDTALTALGLQTYIQKARNAPNSVKEQEVANRFYRGDGTVEGALHEVRKRKREISEKRAKELRGVAPPGARRQPVNEGDYN